MKKIQAILCLFILMAGQAVAQTEDHLVMQFNFENVTGKNVTDPISGITAKLMNQATVEELADRHVLNLGNGTGYLDMTKNAGAIVKGLENFTISVYYRVDSEASLSGAGFFLWCFSRSTANTETSSAYTGYRLNAQRMASANAGWGSEVGMEMSTESTKGRWMHVLYRQTGAKGELFIDGKRVRTNTEMPILSQIFTVAPAYCWIGRAPFSGDSYLKKTLVSDFRLYDTAVSDEVVKTLADETATIEEDYKFGKKGDDTALRTAIEEANAFLGGDIGGYAPNAIAELRDMVEVTQAIIDTERASQVYLDQLTKTLNQQLTSAKKAVNYQPMTMFPVSDNHGFVHPGGIVSQQDIDRAKELLAAKNSRIVNAWNILCNNEYSQSTVATWPTEWVNRGGSGTQNYMNCARGAAMAFQNALRWKISGDRAHADAAVRIMMQWVRSCKGLSGDTNVSLAAGIYGYEWANAAELMRDYDGWSREEFDQFRQWMIQVFYNPAIDFLRRRHDTWSNFRYSNLGERPGHYWSNWGLCNALCVMTIGVLCDDVHIYNEGLSFYKYDHVGTFKDDRTKLSQIVNDGCNEFIGNLVPVMMTDNRGPFGFLGQMQESGRDQGHALMALGLAIDICQSALSQGEDLFAYMDDRIAAGAEFVAASNFGDVDAATLPWKNYNYADCRGTLGASWLQTGVNTGGSGEYRPYWDRIVGYYQGLRGVNLQYSQKAASKVCPDGGGGNYSSNSGGYDHIGFSTLTAWRPAITQEEAITPLSGDIIYKGTTYKNQTNLGGLKYTYQQSKTKAIPADGSDIALVPQLPEGVEDSGNWLWETGETTRQITVKADHSYLYRVTYTAPNGAKSQQAFSIAVAGDGFPDTLNPEITVDGVIEGINEKTVLEGTEVILYAGGSTGWWNEYLWDNGATGSVIVIPALTSSRTYTCQRSNQGGVVSEQQFILHVVPAIQYIDGAEATETHVLAGSSVTLKLQIPTYAFGGDVAWSDGSTGSTLTIDDIQNEQTVNATFHGTTYTYHIYVKAADFSYYQLLSTENGYRLVSSPSELSMLADDNYFVLASDEADLLIGMANGKQNGNKALYYQVPANPIDNLEKLFTIETYGETFCLRNVDYDGLLLQTEWDKPFNLRTNDQPYACEWTQLLMNYTDGAWTIENGKYPGNWFGLWFPENGYNTGEEIALNKTGADIAHLQIFAINKKRFHADYVEYADAPRDITPLLVNPSFANANGFGWTLSGTWGNQRYNGAAEVWHSTDFDISQTINGLPTGNYTVTCQMANGEGSNTGYLYATSGGQTQKAVVKQSCAGSDFDTQRNKMTSSAKYGKLSVDIDVADGTLTLGVKEPSNGTTWLVFDNFTLTYNGILTDGIQQIENCPIVNNQYYDLQGRPVNGTPQKGIYIFNGKKVFIR